MKYDESIFSERDSGSSVNIIEFPHISKIIQSDVVIHNMKLAWEKMNSLVVPYIERQEVGFYIYYDHNTSKFWVGDIVIGEKFSYSIKDAPNLYLGKVESNLQVCAFFHCHTPYYGTIDYHRPTGPSNSDKYFAAVNDLPGILYDYEAPTVFYAFPYDGIDPFPYYFGPEQRSPIYI
ncbi:hypothetical protein [uncultured Duncaniella sp.]|uniref:hypothetical protein n=1 Tax=uncultured Duncaniella sp. TaxID=2768039 RepID=UPI0025A97C78|nr:hypothetical protein [uncultured Duncaniella sp.]